MVSSAASSAAHHFERESGIRPLAMAEDGDAI
jgi:hypothetical protein